MKQWIMSGAIGLTMFAAGFAYAKGKHPNLEHALKASENAVEKLGAAQKANEFDLGGHAAKAKELIEQAIGEIKQATTAAEENKK
jgi:hypothetical protein